MIKPIDPRIRVGSVVQINPEVHNAKDGFFSGCFLLVTEMKSFGVMGFVAIPRQRGENPGEAYYRAHWDEIDYIGQAVWVPNNEPGVDDE